MQHYSFPSIEQFSHVRRNVQHHAQYRGKDEQDEPIYDRTAILPTVSYEGKIKLHGTNAAVVFLNTLSRPAIYCQSRERVIGLDADNHGFARYILELPPEVVDTVVANFPENWKRVAVYGEWAGKGVQSGVAIAEIPKAFYPFAARLIEGEDEDSGWLDIRDWTFPEQFHSIYKFPTFKIDINFEQPEYAVDQINKWVMEVEAECPAGKHFGVSGIGEGIVFSPVQDEFKSSRFWFKAKGEKHSVSKVRKAATVDIEKFENSQKFLECVLSEPRFEQGWNWLKDNGLQQNEKGTGDFIRWIFNDVVKENKPEMAESGIEEKEIGKLVSGPAKKWFFARIQKESLG